MNQQIYTFAVFMLFAASLTKFRQVERIRNYPDEVKVQYK
jgi:hypothetical protein